MRLERREGIVEIVIDAPPVNAFGIGLLGDLADRLDAAAADPEARVVLVRAEGRGFCAGGDVKEVEALAGFEGILGQASGSLRALTAILECPLPVVFAVHGYCIGIGVLLSGAADLLVASADARFVLAEVDNGATAGGVMALRLMPEKRARAAMMTAEPISAEELHRYGSIHRLAPEPSPAAAGRAVAATLAAKDPVVMRALKLSLHATTRAAEIVAAYRAELSFTYELNMRGAATAGRRAFLDGVRPSYDPATQSRLS